MEKTLIITKSTNGWTIDIDNSKATVQVASFPVNMIAASLMATCAKAVLRDYFIDQIIVDADMDGWIFLRNMGVITEDLFRQAQDAA